MTHCFPGDAIASQKQSWQCWGSAFDVLLPVNVLTHLPGGSQSPGTAAAGTLTAPKIGVKGILVRIPLWEITLMNNKPKHGSELWPSPPLCCLPGGFTLGQGDLLKSPLALRAVLQHSESWQGSRLCAV